jgi:hypothetical protein
MLEAFGRGLLVGRDLEPKRPLQPQAS